MTVAKTDELTSADDALSVGEEDKLQQSASALQQPHRRSREADGWLRHGVLEMTPHPAAMLEEIVPRVRRRKRAAQMPEKPAGEIPLEEQVRALAYDFFERRGREHGHDVEDWLRAEEMILARLRGRHVAA